MGRLRTYCICIGTYRLGWTLEGKALVAARSNSATKAVGGSSEHISRIWPDVVSTLIVLPALLMMVYLPVVAGQSSLATDAPAVQPYFIGDPVAGGNVTMHKQVAVLSAWQHGVLPIWFPYEGYGITLAGNQAAPWFAPEIIVHLLFPGNLSMWPIVAAYLGGLGAYLLARVLRRGRLAAVVAAGFYMLAGPMVPNLNLDMINTLAVAPFLVIAVFKLVENPEGKRLRWFAIYALTISQLFLAGFDETVPLVLGMTAVIAVAALLDRGLGAQESLKLLVGWAAWGAVGFAGSAIATYSLLVPLHDYFNHQQAASYLSHTGWRWLVTLLDPWFYGKGVTAGPLQGGSTIWTYGDLVIWPLAILGILTAVRSAARGRTGSFKFLALGMALLVVYGVLGFTDALGVLNLIALPLVHQIVSIRFLSFMWWLPLCCLAAFGIDALRSTSRRTLIVIMMLPLLALVAYYLKARIDGVFASRPGLPAVEGLFVVAFLLALGTLGVAAMPKRTLAPAAAALALVALELMIPRTFYPTQQAYNGKLPVGPLMKGATTSLTVSPGNFYMPSALAAHGLRTLQAFDVFLPKGFVNTVQRYFGHQSPSDPASPIWGFAPALWQLKVNPTTLSALATIGVGTLMSSTYVPIQSPPPPPVSQSLRRLTNRQIIALQQLVGVYFARPDLQKTFALDGRSEALLKWAVNGSGARDGGLRWSVSKRRELAAVLREESADPRFAPFAPIVSTAFTLRLRGTSELFGQGEFVYSLNPATNTTLLWTPLRVIPSTGIDNHPVVASASVVSVSPASVRALGTLQQGHVAKLVSLTQTAAGLTARVDSTSRQLVVLREQFAPGSKATVNNVPVDLVAGDGMFAGVVVPSGVSTIRIDYVSSPTLLLFWLAVLINLGLLASLPLLRPRPGHAMPRRRVRRSRFAGAGHAT